jgi:hypothetical protein
VARYLLAFAAIVGFSLIALIMLGGQTSQVLQSTSGHI